MASCATARCVAAPACKAVFDNRHGKVVPMKRILLLAVVGMVAAHGWAKPEITWSLMHPTPLDADYMGPPATGR